MSAAGPTTPSTGPRTPISSTQPTTRSCSSASSTARASAPEDYQTAPDWIDLATETDPATIHTTAAALLESETFTTSWTYDALNRVLTQTTPDDSVTTQTFGLGGMLQSVAVNVRGAVTATDIVTNIDYNARGQRLVIAYGNGSTTDYEYDPKNFRVTRIHTERPHTDPDLRTVQDLRYHYDPSGNIAQIRDQAQQGVFFDNAYADPTQKFRYDPTYRLIEAHGREHATLAMQTAEGFFPIAHPQDTQTQSNYVQTYRYDPVGNILRMKHVSSVAWERGYDYPTNGNRLRATSDGADDVNDPPNYSIEYQYDAHGNMTAMPHIPGGLTWDDDDRLQSSDTIGGGITYYVYDGAGQRVRKVSVNQSNSTSKQRLYFGSWETYREHKNINTTHDLDLERQTLHVHDDHGRVCLIETKTVDAGTPVVTPANIARYQYSNHLGTANLELDDDAEVISYEEFHPYGTSSYRAANSAIEVSAKRYRYTGQERDEETGLAYHGTRYYAPWLGQWTRCDPAGLSDNVNRYVYVSNRPTSFRDPSGLFGEPDEPLPESTLDHAIDLAEGGLGIVGDAAVGAFWLGIGVLRGNPFVAGIEGGFRGGKNVYSDIGETAIAVARDPLSVPRAAVAPVVEPWSQGRHAKAIGAGLAAVALQLFSPKIISTAVEAASKAKTAAAAARARTASSSFFDEFSAATQSGKSPSGGITPPGSTPTLDAASVVDDVTGPPSSKTPETGDGSATASKGGTPTVIEAPHPPGATQPHGTGATVQRQIYNGPRSAPSYPKDFKLAKNGQHKVEINNLDRADELKAIVPGEWRKVYDDGWATVNGEYRKVSVHYFQHKSGRATDPTIRLNWSNKGSR